MKALLLDFGLTCFFIIICFFLHSVLFFVSLFFALVFYSLAVASVVILFYQHQAKNMLNRAGRRAMK